MSFQQAAWVGGTFGRINQVGRTSMTARAFDPQKGARDLPVMPTLSNKGADPLPGRRRGEIFDPSCPGLIVKRIGKQRTHLPGILPQDD